MSEELPITKLEPWQKTFISCLPSTPAYSAQRAQRAQRAAMAAMLAAQAANPTTPSSVKTELEQKNMDIKSAINVLNIYVETDVPVFLWGAPGIGKSDIVRAAAEKRDLPLIDFRAVQLDPVDLRGIPYVENGSTRWAVPDFFPQVDRDGERGFLFVDELNAAAQSVQAALYQLILDRRLGEYVLPAGWRILAAGNRQSDRAAASRMPSALANRFAHIEIEPDVDNWVSWANQAGIDPAVCAFMRFREASLFQMGEGEQKAFPTPRSWAQVSKVCGTPDIGPDLLNAVAGLVGTGAATEFCAYLRTYRQLPDIPAVIADPESFEVPEDPSVRFAVGMAFGRAATPDNFDNVMVILGKLPADYRACAIRDAVTRDPGLLETEAYQKQAMAEHNNG